jgi:FkbM family methyltransferase
MEHEYHIECIRARYDSQEFDFITHDPLKDVVISGIIFKFGCWEPHISDIIVGAMKPNGVFVDVGANIGWHSKVVQNAGYDVISFEPLPINFKLLQKNCQKNGSILYNIGLGDKEDTLFMHIDPSNFGNSWIDKNGIHEVKVVRLDDLIDDETIQRVDVVKMDVQGFETKIIEGGIKFFNSLKKGTTIIIEVNIHRPDFDFRVLMKQLVSKCSHSYALCYWNDKVPMTLKQAISDVKRENNYPEFDLVLIK